MVQLQLFKLGRGPQKKAGKGNLSNLEDLPPGNTSGKAATQVTADSLHHLRCVPQVERMSGAKASWTKDDRVR